jgi:hypothetical protein
LRSKALREEESAILRDIERAVGRKITIKTGSRANSST